MNFCWKLRRQNVVNFWKFQTRIFSSKLVESKLFEIRERIENEQNIEINIKTQRLSKENYLQRYGMTPARKYTDKHPILLHKRSLIDIKNLLHLLTKRCGLNKLNIIYKKHPELLNISPNIVDKIIDEFNKIGFNTKFETFIKLEPSILYDYKISGSNDKIKSNKIERLKFYITILKKIGIKNPNNILLKCMHIIQRSPESVLLTIKEYEKLNLNLYDLINLYPKCLNITLYHIKKVIEFIDKEHLKLNNTYNIIQKCPWILDGNLEKTDKNIQYFKKIHIWDLNLFMNINPELIVSKKLSNIDQTCKFLLDCGIDRDILKQNLKIISIKKDILISRLECLMKFEKELNEHNIKYLLCETDEIKSEFETKQS